MTDSTPATTVGTGSFARQVGIVSLMGAAVIHAAVVPEHLEEWRVAGIFFIVLALVQVGLAVALLQSQSRRVYLLIAAVSVGTLVLWAVSRTVGLPFGPEAGEPEVLGRADIVSGILELITTAACVSLLSARGAVRESPGRLAGLAATVVLAVLTLFALQPVAAG
jgi:hypothetical protein